MAPGEIAMGGLVGPTGEGRPAFASACSAVDGGTSRCVAPAEIGSVAAGRQVAELDSWTAEELLDMHTATEKELWRRALGLT